MLERISGGYNFSGHQSYFPKESLAKEMGRAEGPCRHSAATCASILLLRAERRERERETILFMIETQMSWPLQNRKMEEASFQLMVMTYSEGSVLS